MQEPTTELKVVRVYILTLSLCESHIEGGGGEGEDHDYRGGRA